ncbi:MAG: PP2C family protein-serine/threonine phosphatase [Candidatus Babeliales bacterium]|nr:PP2C family protein-serine/threonine phosphatase [Candidatus Babeliales bacterium]
MEDRYRIINRPETDEYFFGVFDGHGGSKVSDYLANILHPFYLDYIYEKFTIPDALIKSFESVHKELDSNTSLYQGSTALVAVIKDEKIYVANVGDSRAVLYRNSQAIDLSYDHKSSRKDEVERVQKLGAHVYIPVESLDGSRLQWSKIINNTQFIDVKKAELLKLLNIPFRQIDTHSALVFNSSGKCSCLTRVIGYKLMQDILIPTPEITIIDKIAEDEFIIMASDGIWDVMTSQYAINLVKELLEEGKSVDNVARRLARRARILGSADNITVLIIK